MWAVIGHGIAFSPCFVGPHIFASVCNKCKASVVLNCCSSCSYLQFGIAHPNFAARGLESVLYCCCLTVHLPQYMFDGQLVVARVL
jgi:hypothetical protein